MGGGFPLCIEKETRNASVGSFDEWKFSLGALGTSEDWHFYNRKESSVYIVSPKCSINFVSIELIVKRMGGGCWVFTLGCDLKLNETRVQYFGFSMVWSVNQSPFFFHHVP